jgi:hypothetical protein
VCNSAFQRSASSGHCHTEARSSVCFEKSLGIDNGVARDRYGKVIATVFALLTNLARDPPDSRVIEQHHFGDHLEKIDKVIMPANVS